MKLNEKFQELPEEKQQRIINAGLEVFGQNDYKHASTEDIAAKAGISKGLLFYYFQNKKTLYTFLFDWAAVRVKDSVMSESLSQTTDFFDYCFAAAAQKCRLLQQNPYLMDFFTRAFYSRQEAVSGEMDSKILQEMAAVYGTYFKKIDFFKFREDVNPQDIFQMLTWLTEGYLYERQRAGLGVELDDVMEKFRNWSECLKKVSYKEEYLR